MFINLQLLLYAGSANEALPSDIITAIIRLLVGSPPLLIMFASAYLSGHMWTYLILSYVSKKERKILYSLIGRVSIGITWFAFVAIPVSLIIYKNVLFSVERLVSISITTTVFSLASQAILLFVINVIAREKK